MGSIRQILLCSALLCSVLSAKAQMWAGQDTLYGNEWLRTATTYWRIPIASDGLYRVSEQDLSNWGWSASQQTPGGAWRLYHQGQEQPLYLTQESVWGAGDYLEFWGQKNRGELDRFLFSDANQQQLNPRYSLVSDTASYYLAWITDNSSLPRRFSALPNDLSNPPAAAPYLWRTSEVVFSDQYLKEYLRTTGLTIYHSHYAIAEGYGSRNVNQLLQDGNAPQLVQLPVLAPYPVGPAPVLAVRYACAMDAHQQQILAEGTLLHESSFSGWKVENPVMSLPAAVNWADGLSVESRGLADTRDEASLSVLRLLYPSLPDALGQSSVRFQHQASASAVLLEVAGLSAAAGPPILYDLTSGRRLEAALEGGVVRFVLPASTQDLDLLLLGRAGGWLSPLPASPSSFEDLAPTTIDYLIITDERLSQGSSTDWVRAYADYRQSPAGGGYRVGVVSIRELYEQFAYGVNRHPLAIRNFIHWLEKVQNGALRYVFILGKGRDYINLRSPAQLAAADGLNFFVPSFGYPASDNLLAAGNEYDAPVVALGRLPAVNGEEVRIYLNKIQALESQANGGQTVEERAWMKNILHLGGGGNAGEQQSIRYNLEQMGRTLEQSSFGAQTSGFYKTSSDPIQTSLSEQIFSRINKGVSIISFFGHSSPGVFDFNIDNPDNYDNYGKYPLMLSLGCFSGDMFVDYRSIGERFVMLENKGTIAFGASKGFGYIHALYNVARNFYAQMGGEYYGQGIGDGLQAVYRAFEGYTDMPHRTLIQQFALNGDPAIRLNPAPGPDYLINPASLKFEPSVVSVQSDSFEVVFDLMNIGKHVGDTLRVRLEQALPNGTLVFLRDWRGAAPPYAQTIRLRLPTQGRASVGLNSILITVDPENELAEAPVPAAKLNNSFVRPGGQTGAQLYVVDNNAIPVWPPSYGLIGQTPITLKASTADALAPERTYLLEIDTDPRFGEPLASTAITQKGGVVQWTPPLNWQDSTVYYWRISPDSLPGSPGFTWEERSFTYLADSPNGWSQSDWGQWRKNGFDRMRVDEGGEFSFTEQLINVRIRNKLFDNAEPPGLVYNNEGFAVSVRPWDYLSEGIAVIVSEPNTAAFWRNPPAPGVFNPGDYGIPTGNTRVFAFPTLTAANRANLITFLRDVVPANYYVFLLTIVKTPSANIHAESWAQDSVETGTNLFRFLEAEGAANIRTLQSLGSVPYVFMYQKGIGPIDEAIAGSITAQVNAEADIPRVFTEGDFTSVAIGPAKRWSTISWQINNTELSDTNKLTLLAGASLSELDSIRVYDQPGEYDISDLNEQAYNYIQFRWSGKDLASRTPSQLTSWRALYEGLPDGAIDASAYYVFESDTLQQGQLMRLGVGITLTSAEPMDSLLVKYIWLNNSVEQANSAQKLAPLSTADDSIHFNLQLDTRSVSGNQQLIVEINPDEAQPELFLFNNSFSKDFYVKKDGKAPLLDVTFDGSRILDGDIVSSRPLILARLKDENPYLPLDNPAIFDISLTNPDGSVTDISTNDPGVIFRPASASSQGFAELEIEASLAQDGVYLLKIQASDISGNAAGNLQYEVSFRVINEQMLSHVLPYPNPLVDQAYFVYTLTGSEPPVEYAIKIMSISGVVVRVLTQNELGALQIGSHRTDFAWDGRDEYGDKLANGVYLYQVEARSSSGETLRLFQTDADKYFKGGLGKLVILR